MMNQKQVKQLVASFVEVIAELRVAFPNASDLEVRAMALDLLATQRK
jgi:hypothetical protein